MGHGWSGSTILGNVLGQLDGFFHAGELRRLWGEALPAGAACGCGRPVAECEVWSAVLSHSLMAGVDARRAARAHEAAVRVRKTPGILRLERGRPRGWPPGLAAWADVAARLYRATAEVTGARVLVDSSKRAGDAALLRLLEGVEPFYVHLVRDPRAVAYSWRKREEPGHGAVRTSVEWTSYNLLDEAIRRRAGRNRAMLVRYEDFARSPGAVAEEIALMAEGRPAPTELPFIAERTALLRETHTILGNPVRFATGRVEIREDAEWRARLPRRERLMVTALTLPLLVRYRYRLGTGRGAGRGSG
jgi:hypothetical protein